MIRWSDAYRVGNERIDFEHRIFFGLIVDFGQRRQNRESASRLMAVLDEIVLYARFHFRSEENVMVDVGYPGLDAHRRLHHELTETLGNRVTGLQLGLYTAAQVEDFLFDWFVNHVTQEDMKLGAFLGAPR